MTTKLTDPQIRIMRAIRQYGSPYIPGMNGGGQDQAYGALLRKGMVLDRALTEAGSAALDEIEAAEQARMLPRRVATTEERIHRRVTAAASKFIAEARDGDVPFEPTDANLAEAFKNSMRPINVELYPAVRVRVGEIRAERA